MIIFLIVASLKNIIYNLNFLSATEDLSIQTINRRIDFHHRDIEIYSCLNKLKYYSRSDLDIVITKLLYRNASKLYNWYYEIHFLLPNNKVKLFLEKTYIGLPLEINKIIASFLPSFKTIDLTFSLKLDKTTLNSYQHKKIFFVN